MKLGIIGSRAYKNKARIRKIVDFYINQYKDITIVSGGCPDGGDALAKSVAIEMGVKYEEFPPKHASHNQYCILPVENYGKSFHVGNFFERNTLIAENCDHLIAFIVKGVKANGTMDTVGKARKLDKKVFVFEDE